MKLTRTQKAWLDRDDALWRKARQLASRNPELDVSGLYHTLRNLERTPTERLARGLAHGTLRPRAS